MGPRNGRVLAVVAAALFVAARFACGGTPDLVVAWEGTRCRVELEAERGDGILSLRERCLLSKEEAMEALAETLRMLRAQGESLSRYRLLYLGRLVDYPWLSEALARWAARSGRWDPVRARPRTGRNVNRFVANALLESGALAPFGEVVGREGLRVTDVSLEKVLISPASKLPFGRELRAEGIATRARLPFDALTHLVLTAEEDR